MTYRYGAENMCDGGIDDTIDAIRDAVQKLVEKHFEGMPGVGKLCAEYVIENLDEALESVVQDVDEHITSCVDSAREEGFESGMEAACQDMVPYDEFSDMESERDDLAQKVDDLEEELEAAKTVINVDGLDYTWIPEKGVFVSRIGTVLKVVRTEDNSVSATLAW